jgi:outer membrane lipoprotein SlyB
MFIRRGPITTVLFAGLFGLTGCIPPQQQRVVYRQGDYGRSQPNMQQPSEQQPPEQQQETGNYCQSCGRVRGIEQLETRTGNTGGGAFLGAIIGGLIGNQFGGGAGKAAATAAGFLGGAAVGNSVEESNARASSGYVWRFRVELDDGRWATVTQYANPGFRPGDRVFLNHDHIEYARN